MNLSDSYVDLLERVICENRELRETIKTQNDRQERMFQDLTQRLSQQNTASEMTKSQKPRRRKEKITVPPICRLEFRKMYNVLMEKDDFRGFVFTESFSAKQNQDLTQVVAKAVQDDHGGPDKCPWSQAQLKGAGATYFKSKRDSYSRNMKGNIEEHRMLCRRQGRMRDKLQRRLDTLEETETTEENREKIRKALTLEYTSSDESDVSEAEDGTGPKLKGYVVKRLPWEKGTLRKVKAQLDSTYLKNLPARSKRNLLPRSRNTEVSRRPIPENIIKWAVRDITPTNSFSLPRHTSTPQ